MTLGTNTKLTPAKVVKIRQLYAEGWTQPQLAREFGVGPPTIGKVVRGESWRKVTQGQPVTTDSEAELRQLTTPEPPPEAIQASLEKLHKLMAADQQKANDPFKNPYGEEAMALKAEEHTRNIQRALERQGELTAQLERARAENARRTRHLGTGTTGIIDNAQRDNAAPSGAINAEQLLETLKDENQPQGDAGSGNGPGDHQG